MNLLAFDTSTDVMSIAVQRTVDGSAQVWQQTAVGGAQTSTHLIPVIQQLMAQADLRFDQLDAIVFGRGPGSFTGLRTACSVAQGLAFGAKVPVLAGRHPACRGRGRTMPVRGPQRPKAGDGFAGCADG